MRSFSSVDPRQRGLADEFGDQDPLRLQLTCPSGTGAVRPVGLRSGPRSGCRPDRLPLRSPGRCRPTAAPSRCLVAAPRSVAAPRCRMTPGWFLVTTAIRAPRWAAADSLAISRSPGPSFLIGGKALSGCPPAPTWRGRGRSTVSPAACVVCAVRGCQSRRVGRGRGVGHPGSRDAVVCGRSEVIAKWDPIIAFSNVDLPTFGRPTMQANPLRKSSPSSPLMR